jgi:hypothetical protein
MERVRHKPEIGEVCIYNGNKSNIKGFSVICTRNKDKYSVWIKACGSATVWDTKEWSCSTIFLSPQQITEPDWEV